MSFTLLGILNSQAAGAGGAKAYDFLETVSLSSTANSVTFSSLSQYSDYQHLQFRFSNKAEADGGSQASFTTMFFNGDATNSYASHSLNGVSGNVESIAFPNSNRMRIGRMPVTFGTQHNNMFAQTVLDVLDFQNTSKNTTVRSLSVCDSHADDVIQLASGAYFKTNAIDSVTFDIFGNNNFSVFSRFSLYGIKGA